MLHGAGCWSGPTKESKQMTLTSKEAASTPIPSSQVANLVVIRISDSSAMKELHKKTVETAFMYPAIPGAERLAALGASPLERPESVDGAVFARSGFRSVLFRLPGTDTQVLLALGSATKVNLGVDDNSFVSLLADTLQMTKFESLWVADFARLLRSIDYLSDTWKAVRHQCRYVRHAGSVIDTHSPTAEIQFLFEALSAAAEARSTVKRTTVGKMRAYTDGKCPIPKQSVPRGFAIGRDRKLKLASPVPREAVRTIVQVLGDPTLTNIERVRRVAETGAYSITGSRSQRRGVRVDELNNPSTTVARWYELLEVWRTGQWVVEYELPTLLSTTNFDLPVEITEHGGIKTWRLTFQLPVPDGGWASPDEFDAATMRRDQRAEHVTPKGGGTAGSRRKPFSGLPSWEHEGWQYALMSRRQGAYELRRRPKANARKQRYIQGEWRWVARGWGRRPNLEGEAVGCFDAALLHTAVTQGVVDAAVEGLQLRRASQAIIDAQDGLDDALAAQLRTLRRKAANARRNAIDSINESLRREYLAEHETAVAAAEQVESDLVRFAGSSGQIAVDADSVALALAAVADVSDHVGGEVADALREILTGFRLVPASRDTCRWEASLRLPLAGGTLTIGPASGVIEMGLARQLAGKRAHSLAARAPEAAQRLVGDAEDLTVVADELGIATYRRVAQTVRDHLKELGLSAPAATFLVSDGTAAARAVVWERLNGRPYPRHLPQRYAAHIGEVYIGGRVRGQVSRRRRQQAARSAIAHIQGAGGWIPDKDIASFQRQLGITDHALTTYVRGRRHPGLVLHPFLTEVDGGLGLLPCPHSGCDGWATLVSPHPETPTDLLCPTCMRMPDPASSTLVFPDDYR